MAKNKQLPDLALGKRWPHVLLQWFPQEWKRKYLHRHSGGTSQKSFNLTESLQNASHFLLIWPERTEDALMAFPAMRALRETTGSGAIYAHLCPAGLTSTIADLFPGDQLLSWSREDLAWHEPAIQNLAASLKTFSPHVSINLMRPSASVIKALVKSSGAELRMSLEDGDTSYANLRVNVDPERSLASHHFQFLNVWRYAGFNPSENWPRLQFDTAQRRDAAEVWNLAGVEPEKTWLHVYNPEDISSHPLNDEFHVWLLERIQMRESSRVSIALVILNAPNNLIAREGKWLDVPILKPSGLSAFASVVEMARGVAGFQGAGIHIASLTEVRCLAFLKRDESAYDVSEFNSMVTVEYL